LAVSVSRHNPKIGQAYVSGIVTEADPAVMTDAVFTTVNDEAVQMLVGPAKSRLQRHVQISDGRIAADEDATPDQGTDGTQDDAELVHAGL
jgi:hypothetical protein